LSVVHGVVKDHHGEIEIESAVGQGASFSLYFPACREEITVLTEEPVRGGAETILIVDDEAMQIDVTARIAAKLGYVVLTARSGEEALQLFRHCQEAKQSFPDLVLLDMVMGPGLNGVETYQRMKAINPNQKALIISGYGESPKVSLAKALGVGGFLRKPVELNKLAKAIRKELDQVE
jgi:CheY-like chemotaxis protein